jgi:hypothetical protein
LLRILIALGLAAQRKIALKPSSSQTTKEQRNKNCVLPAGALVRDAAVSFSRVKTLM